MFDEMPSRRITERRKELLSALYAALSFLGGYVDFKAHHHFEWSLVIWAFLLLARLGNYWKIRHPDPWNPPIEGSEPPPINELKMAGKTRIANTWQTPRPS